MSHSRSSWLPAALAFTTLAVIGCQGGEEAAAPPATGSRVKHESPQAVFDAAKEAMNAKQFDQFVGCLTPESQDVMIFGLAMGAQMAKAFSQMGGALGQELGGADAKAEIDKKFAPLDQVLEKYELNENMMSELGGDEPMDPMAAVKKVSDKIGDKPAFIQELMAALESIGDEASQGPQAMFQTELSDIKIEGDTASATATNPQNPEESGPVHFRQVDGGWLLDLSKELEQMPGA